MFDIGFWEILVCAVVALVVVGPDEFPTLIRNVGRGVGKVRRFLGSVKDDLDFEIDKANEIKRLMAEEAKLAELDKIIDPDSPSVSVQGKSAAVNKVEQSHDGGKAESDPGQAQPVADRQPDQRPQQ